MTNKIGENIIIAVDSYKKGKREKSACRIGMALQLLESTSIPFPKFVDMLGHGAGCQEVNPNEFIEFAIQAIKL